MQSYRCVCNGQQFRKLYNVYMTFFTILQVSRYSKGVVFGSPCTYKIAKTTSSIHTTSSKQK